MNRSRLFFRLLLATLSLWAGNKITWQIRTDAAAHRSIEDIMNRALNDLANDPFHISTAQPDLLGGLALLFIVAMVWFYRWTNAQNRRRGEEHGSARWASHATMRRYQNRTRSQNLLFTQSERLNLDSKATQRNLNALVVGGSGSGKSRSYVLPNLHQANTSFTVTDPKGELYRTTAGYLERKGYAVRTLNLIDFDQSNHFNPLAYFDPQQAEVDCMILTDNFVTNTNGRKPQDSNGFWEKAERALMNALLAYVYFTKGPVGSLIDVVDLLAQMQASEADENHKSDVDLIFEAVAEMITDYDSDTTSDLDMTALTVINGLRFASSQYTTYTQGAGETKKSVIISLGVRMAPLHMGALRDLLATDDIELDQLGTRKTALFVITPDTNAAFNFVAAIFYEQLFETSIYAADHAPGGHLPIQVQCFMDEFANIGKIPSFERKIAVMRSRGISVSVIIQNFAQGKSAYKDDWDTIVGNCDSLLFLGGQEKNTTETISKMLGKQTIIGSDTSVSKGSSGSFSTSDRILARDLLTPDEVGRIPTDECLYFLRGELPCRSHKLPAPTF